MFKIAKCSLLMLAIVALAASAFFVSAPRAQSGGAAPGEAWRSSPHHGVINGATGNVIPCRCRFQGRDYRLGEAVCMNTHVGTVLAKCDLSQNNTTWAPTSDPCVMSLAPAAAASVARLSLIPNR